MSTGIRIQSGQGKVKRNLHFWIIGIFALVSILGIFAADGFKEKKKPGQETQKVDQEIKPKEADLKPRLQKQADDAAGPPADLSVKQVPAIPTAATEGVGKDAQVEDPSVVEARKRQEEADRSNLLVINETSSLIDATLKSNQSAIQQQADAAAQLMLKAAAQDDTKGQAELMKTALAAGQEQKPGVAMPDARVQLDRQWNLDQQQVRNQETVREDPKNSPYTLFQGTLIPAVLLSKINSDLPGQITAQVSQDVFDGVSGSHLIIPKGSKIVGEYNHDINAGQERIMVAFHRIVFPGGRSISLGGMPGMDDVGQAGLPGDLDNHFFKRFGSSFLVAALGAIVDARGRTVPNSVVNTGDGSVSTTGAVTSAAGQVLVDISRSILQRNNQIAPTLTIKQGEKFNIFVRRDIAILPTGAK